MELGVVEGTVRLAEHDPAWADEAKRMIAYLKEILVGQDIYDYQHVGSTSIRNIPAKPIRDIAVAIKDESVVEKCRKSMTDAGFQYLGEISADDWMYFTGHPGQNDRTHHIHFVTAGSEAWIYYLAYRDYLNADQEAAAKYAALKRELTEKYKDQRRTYHEMKVPLIEELQKEAIRWWRFEREHNA